MPDTSIVTLINLNDCYSRGRLLSYPCWLGSQRVERLPATEDHQLVLRLAFVEPKSATTLTFVQFAGAHILFDLAFDG